MRSPGWARGLLRWVAGRDADWLLGDLEEEFQELADRRGPAAARRWYIAQALRSIAPLLRRPSSRAPVRKAPMALDLDLRFALRRIRRTRLVSTAIVLTIALGIGATTAVYSVVRGVLFKALPYPEPDRLVRLMTLDPARPADLPSDSWMELQRWNRESRLYQALGGIWEGGSLRTFLLADRIERLPVVAVTEGFDRVLQVRLLLGRSFAPEEYLPDGPRAVLLAAGFWRRELGSDRAVIGRSIVVADTARQIVGVLDNGGSEFPSPTAALWMPVAPRPGHWMAGARSRWIAVYGRLRSGISVSQAQAELQTLVGRTPTDAGDEASRRVARVIPLVRFLTGPVRPVLLLLTAAVIVALIVACANVGILIMAQAETRLRELAVRSALGGTGLRLSRLLAIETLLTAGVGGLIGVLLARPLVDLFLHFYPERLVRAQDIAVDLPVLIGAMLAIAAACVAVSWPTARRARKVDLVSDLKHGAGGAGPVRGSLRSALVVIQLSLSVALATGGLLLVRSFAAIASVDPGFEPRQLTFALLTASPVRHPGERIPQLFGEVVARMKALPGVEQAATVNYLPLPTSIVGWGSNAERPDRPGEEYPVQYRHVGGEYLAAMGLPLTRGRSLTDADGPDGARVALVNEAFVAKAFPGEDPLGRHFTLQGQDWEIIGVVGDMRYWGLARPIEAEVYVPLSQAFTVQAPQFFAGQTLILRTALSPAALTHPIREAVRDIDPSMAVGTIGLMSERVDRALAPERFRALLVGGLAGMALLLAGLGIYAVMAYTVARQTREIGIRLALGASVERVRHQVLRQALRLALAGTALGLPLALAGTRLLRGFLVGVSPTDPTSLGTVVLLFLGLAGFAAALPARRASRVNPLEAIRSE